MEADVPVEVDIRGSGGRGKSAHVEDQKKSRRVVCTCCWWWCVCICAEMVGHPGMHQRSHLSLRIRLPGIQENGPCWESGRAGKHPFPEEF